MYGDISAGVWIYNNVDEEMWEEVREGILEGGLLADCDLDLDHDCEEEEEEEEAENQNK